MIQQLKDIAVELGFEELSNGTLFKDNKEIRFRITDNYNAVMLEVITNEDDYESYLFDMLDLDRANLTIEDHISKLKKFVNS